MKSYSDLLKDIKKDIKRKTHYRVCLGSHDIIVFTIALNSFNGNRVTKVPKLAGTLRFESDNKVYYHLDDSGDNIRELPEEKDELFNFMVFTGLTQEDIDIFCEIVDLYYEN